MIDTCLDKFLKCCPDRQIPEQGRKSQQPEVCDNNKHEDFSLAVNNIYLSDTLLYIYCYV